MMIEDTTTSHDRQDNVMIGVSMQSLSLVHFNYHSVLPISLIHKIFEYIHNDFKSIIHREDNSFFDDDENRLPLSVIMYSGLEDYFEKVLLSRRFKERLCEECVKRGQLNSLKWMKMKADTLQQGLRLEGLSTKAASLGHLHILQWLRGIGQVSNIRGQICLAAARGGHLECMKWAYEMGFSMDSEVCTAAAEGGYLDCLKWARKKNCTWYSDTCRAAARGGHLYCLIWARENGCHWNSDTCSAAAGGGHLDCLKWAREHGCLWHADTCIAAARGGHLNCLVFSRKHGCPWNPVICRSEADERGHHNILKWMASLGY